MYTKVRPHMCADSKCGNVLFICGFSCVDFINCIGVVNSVPGGYKYGDLALLVGGVSRIGTIKYGFESRGLRLERDCAGEDQQQQ
jgi:hypothetical protein